MVIGGSVGVKEKQKSTYILGLEKFAYKKKQEFKKLLEKLKISEAEKTKLQKCLNNFYYYLLNFAKDHPYAMNYTLIMQDRMLSLVDFVKGKQDYRGIGQFVSSRNAIRVIYFWNKAFEGTKYKLVPKPVKKPSGYSLIFESNRKQEESKSNTNTQANKKKGKTSNISKVTEYIQKRRSAESEGDLKSRTRLSLEELRKRSTRLLLDRFKLLLEQLKEARFNIPEEEYSTIKNKVWRHLSNIVRRINKIEDRSKLEAIYDKLLSANKRDVLDRVSLRKRLLNWYFKGETHFNFKGKDTDKKIKDKLLPVAANNFGYVFIPATLMPHVPWPYKKWVIRPGQPVPVSGGRSIVPYSPAKPPAINTTKVEEIGKTLKAFGPKVPQKYKSQFNRLVKSFDKYEKAVKNPGTNPNSVVKYQKNFLDKFNRFSRNISKSNGGATPPALLKLKSLLPESLFTPVAEGTSAAILRSGAYAIIAAEILAYLQQASDHYVCTLMDGTKVTTIEQRLGKIVTFNYKRARKEAAKIADIAIVDAYDYLGIQEPKSLSKLKSQLRAVKKTKGLFISKDRKTSIVYVP